MKFWLKAIISVALLALLIWKSNIGDILNVMAGADLRLYVAAFALFLFQQVVVTYCWQLLLVAQKNSVPFWQTLKVHFIGSFFGTFLPSSISMDVVRAYHLSRHLRRRGVDAASSMFVTRVAGFGINFLLALIVAIPVSRANHDFQILWAVAISTFAFFTAIWVTLHRRSLQLLKGLLRRFKLARIADKLAHLRESILEVVVAKRAMLKMLALSVFFQILGVVIIYVVGRSVGIELDFWHYCIYVPLITAIAVLPISVLGIGIREGAFVFFFTQAGVPKAAALSLSLLLFSQSLLMAAMGGIWYLVDKTKLQLDTTIKREALSITD
ncbi:MAG: flippase-like domain-containing protein [candidate division KSB1 bacterium]|nr:flippase-like domain-containing protein [candidate division KSB1 bacterium]MDZ7368533.1 flippase-like domain-containing protein [candidate division KSB1 bacterium]MDZ7406239.1 flippase-like domain-containing protein [candidate division KSB1 bacterium]